MVRIDAKHVLFIEPARRASALPLIDDTTRRMAGALRTGVVGAQYRGVHVCQRGRSSLEVPLEEACAARSSHYDVIVRSRSGPMVTNTLAVHYLAFHRDEIPASEVAKVGSLIAEPVHPATEELGHPDRSKLPLP